MGTAKTTGNQPDWTDIAQMMREMMKLHEGSTVHVDLVTDGALYAGTITVVARGTAPQFVGPGEVWKGCVQVAWPGNQFKTMEGAVFYALHKLDALMCRDVWHQEQFA